MAFLSLIFFTSFYIRHAFQALYAEQDVDNDENSIEHFLNSFEASN